MTHLDEVKKEIHFDGYIKNNILSAKRLIHITGLQPQAFKIRRIEIARDPCPVKVS